jgi:hypothetical protein
LNAVRSNKANFFWDNLQLYRQTVLVEDSIKVKKIVIKIRSLSKKYILNGFEAEGNGNIFSWGGKCKT